MGVAMPAVAVADIGTELARPRAAAKWDGPCPDNTKISNSKSANLRA